MLKTWSCPWTNFDDISKALSGQNIKGSMNMSDDGPLSVGHSSVKKSVFIWNSNLIENVEICHRL